MSLPKNTPVFFRIDQVNTILYDIKITVGEENSVTQSQAAPKSSTSFTGTLDFLLAILKVISEVKLVGDESNEIQKAKNALTTLRCKLQAAKALNNKLDGLLYESEMPKFSGFKSIQTRVPEAANDTAEKLYCEGEAALAAVYQVYSDIKKDGCSPVLKKFPVLAKLGDPSKEKAKDVLNVFAQTAKKLRMIETAKWRKDDTQERVLKENISYTCVIRPAVKPPAVKLPEKYPQLRDIEFVVTVNRMPDLSGRKLTFGSFLTRLPDDKIEMGIQSRFAESLAVLTHIPLYSHNFDYRKFLKFRGAVAMSGGLAVGSISDSDKKFSLGQLPTLLGGSFLFAAPKSESLLAFTVGGALRPVKGDVTMPGRTFGWFFAITLSYDIWEPLSDKLNVKKKE